MPAIIDIAQEHAAEMLAHQISAARSKVTAVSSSFCESCGEPIPEARRRAVIGVSTCATCQEVIEHRAKFTGMRQGGRS